MVYSFTLDVSGKETETGTWTNRVNGCRIGTGTRTDIIVVSMTKARQLKAMKYH